MNNFQFYTVVNNHLRPKNPFDKGNPISIFPEVIASWRNFESFASQNTFPIANPEMIKGRTEIAGDEVELIEQIHDAFQHKWLVPNMQSAKILKQTGYKFRQAYLIKEAKVGFLTPDERLKQSLYDSNDKLLSENTRLKEERQKTLEDLQAIYDKMAENKVFHGLAELAYIINQLKDLTSEELTHTIKGK